MSTCPTVILLPICPPYSFAPSNYLEMSTGKRYLDALWRGCGSCLGHDQPQPFGAAIKAQVPGSLCLLPHDQGLTNQPAEASPNVSDRTAPPRAPVKGRV